ncbi:hypothetical protein RI129_007456 [Pyrocoelia pectoralis]|uniref:C2H2-type domain-containing protein n=1 Tax=Pyrocoelia pectoralis TaxID=417401 RepID=A0AAN7ZML8_9COLE
MTHVKRSHGSVELKCYHDTYVTNYNLLNHMKIHRTYLKDFTCEQCSYVTKRKDCLKQHKQIHRDSKEFTCNQCNFTTKSNVYLHKHMKIHCPNLEELKCQHCSFTSKWKSNLYRHVKVQHKKQLALYYKIESVTTYWDT